MPGTRCCRCNISEAESVELRPCKPACSVATWSDHPIKPLSQPALVLGARISIESLCGATPSDQPIKPISQVWARGLGQRAMEYWSVSQTTLEMVKNAFSSLVSIYVSKDHQAQRPSP